jgi:hypothetical protein
MDGTRMSDQMPTMKNWYWDGQSIGGEVYNHPNKPRFHDGKHITTSRVIDVYREDGKLYAKCSSRTYLLDGVDPYYEKAFPGAEERLLKVWNEKRN